MKVKNEGDGEGGGGNEVCFGCFFNGKELLLSLKKSYIQAPMKIRKNRV